MQGLVDNKKEYTKYIQDSITIPIAEKIKSYYDFSYNNKTGLKGFQEELNKIKEWNNNYIESEYNDIIKKSKYNNLDKLYKFVIITSIKIKIYEYKNSINNVKIKYPSIQDYIHKCYINSAIWAWKNPFLFFKNNLKLTEIQNNYNIIEKNIKKIIKNTLIECIPIDDIIEQIDNNIFDNNIINQYIELDIDDKDNKTDEDILELNKNTSASNSNNQETFSSSLFSAISRNTNKLNRFLTKSNDNKKINHKTYNDNSEREVIQNLDVNSINTTYENDKDYNEIESDYEKYENNIENEDNNIINNDNNIIENDNNIIEIEDNNNETSSESDKDDNNFISDNSCVLSSSDTSDDDEIKTSKKNLY